jgi:hypothetical protein
MLHCKNHPKHTNGIVAFPHTVSFTLEVFTIQVGHQKKPHEGRSQQGFKNNYELGI